MTFTTDKVTSKINSAMGAFLLLHSSNQALIEAEVAKNASSWRPIIMNELGQAENIVLAWRQNGFLYFKDAVLQSIINVGQEFLDSKEEIDCLFEELNKKFSNASRQKIIDKLNFLNSAIKPLDNSIYNYLLKLKSYQIAMETPYTNMQKTAAQVQEQANNIKAEIISINAHITNLKNQIIKDREAIAKARKKQNESIVETIFGVIFAPFTNGASLILAGIGVTSIAEGEDRVHQLESTISDYQKNIASEQLHLNEDQRQIATLQSLSMSLEIAINDMTLTQTALDNVRATFNLLESELLTTTQKIQKSNTSKEIIIEKVWYDATINTWSDIIDFCKKLRANNISPAKHVKIG